MRKRLVNPGCCMIASLLSLGCRGSTGDHAATRSAPAVAGGAAQNAAAAERIPGREDASVIWIVAEDACEILLVDAEGRRTGVDPTLGTRVEEIPRSNYFSERIEDPSGEAGFETTQMVIREPESGRYSLSIRGAAAGDCDIGIRFYDVAGAQKTVDADTVSCGPGEGRRYVLVFDRESASRCALTAADEKQAP